MSELIKQIRKQKNPPRKSASETWDRFRSRVINGARKRRIGAEKPLGSRYLWQEAHSIKEKETSMTMRITNQKTTLAVMSCETRITNCTYAGKLDSTSNLTNPDLGETVWDGQAKREHAKNRPQSPLKCSSTRCSEAPPDHIVKTNKFAPKCEESNVEGSVAQPVTPYHHSGSKKKCREIDGAASDSQKSQKPKSTKKSQKRILGDLGQGDRRSSKKREECPWQRYPDILQKSISWSLWIVYSAHDHLDQPWHRRKREERGIDPVGSQCVYAVGGLQQVGVVPNLSPTKMAVVRERGL